MSELPEMRASDTERERIAEALREAVAEGRLTMEEFDERLDAAYKARTHGELTPLISDLPAPGAAPTAPVPATGRIRWAERIGGPATSTMAFAFWGGFERKGRWTAPRQFTAFAMMAGGAVDLREARFEDREVVIRCFTIMGGIDVVVPPEVNLQVNGFGLMGGFGEEGSDAEVEPDPTAPVVRVTGFALMGGVGVRRKRTKAEKARLKAERERERLERGDDRKGRGELD
ncbi:DUF1707 domain-containing protein [Streptomyces sp. NPDC051018]|uniref:DUF1707 SHOCT-like domain-containing protein n=1 Tax=Streptomyces sp. NPDC051018 TaxID=3365639 RepID=UPI003795EF6E